MPFIATGNLGSLISIANGISHRGDIYTAVPSSIMKGIIISARFMSVFFSVATVYVVYLTGKEIGG